MFPINYKDPRPIYEQVKNNLRRSILMGLISPDEKIPSVRDLAAQLAINPNTIQRAYRELEGEGYIYSVPGKGSFVSDGGDYQRVRKAELLKQLDAVIRELIILNVTIDEIHAHITAKNWKEEEI